MSIVLTDEQLIALAKKLTQHNKYHSIHIDSNHKVYVCEEQVGVVGIVCNPFNPLTDELQLYKLLSILLEEE